MDDQILYCKDLVRRRDRDRYWCALLTAQPFKNDLFALYALKSEISEIGISVTEPLIGQMRLRWWLDALTLIYEGRPPKNPVAVSLSELVSKRNISRSMLERLIEGHEQDLVDQPMETLEALKSYAFNTSSSLIELSLAITGINNDNSRHTAHHLGVAWTLLGTIRSIPFNIYRNRILLPVEMCKRHDFRSQSLLDKGYLGQSPDGMQGVVFELMSDIQTHLNHARSGWLHKSNQFTTPLLLATIADGYLEELKDKNGDPFQLNHRRQGPRVRDMIRLKIAALRRRF
jgi:phytoene synthase